MRVVLWLHKTENYNKSLGNTVPIYWFIASYHNSISGLKQIFTDFKNGLSVLKAWTTVSIATFEDPWYLHHLPSVSGRTLTTYACWEQDFNPTSIYICLFVVFLPTREFFTHLETSPLHVKSCKYWPILDTQGHWPVRVL